MTIHEDRLAHAKNFDDDLDKLHAADIAWRQHTIDSLTAERDDLIAGAIDDAAKIEALEAEIARLTNLLSQHEPQSPWGEVVPISFATSEATRFEVKEMSPDREHGRNMRRNALFGPEGLRLFGRRERVGTGDSARDYSSADVLARHVPLDNYFRLTVVARMSKAVPGFWPCPIWLRPANGTHGEIDGFERFGPDPWVKATLHEAYAKNLRYNGPGRDWRKETTPEGDHTFVIEKTPGRILVLMDGTVLADFRRDQAPAGFDWDGLYEVPARTWYTRFTIQIGFGNRTSSKVGLPPADWAVSEVLVKSAGWQKLKAVA